MPHLRQRMIDAMPVCGSSSGIQDSYLWAVADLARYYQRSPALVSLEETEDYVRYLVKECHLSDATCRLYLQGVRFLPSGPGPG